MKTYLIRYGSRNSEDGWIEPVGVSRVRAESASDALESWDSDNWGDWQAYAIAPAPRYGHLPDWEPIKDFHY